jgi:hypothetical protein
VSQFVSVWVTQSLILRDDSFFQRSNITAIVNNLGSLWLRSYQITAAMSDGVAPVDLTDGELAKRKVALYHVRRRACVDADRKLCDQEVRSGDVFVLFYGQAQEIIESHLIPMLDQTEGFPEVIDEPTISTLSTEVSVKELREIQHRKHERTEHMAGKTIINISGGTVTGLNIGTLIGDMTNNVTILQDQGQQKVAEAIKALVESIAKDDSLGDKRKDMVESLATVSEQAVLPADKRKTGMVRTLLGALQDAVKIAKAAKDAWDLVGPAIASHFGLNLPI